MLSRPMSASSANVSIRVRTQISDIDGDAHLQPERTGPSPKRAPARRIVPRTPQRAICPLNMNNNVAPPSRYGINREKFLRRVQQHQGADQASQNARDDQRHDGLPGPLRELAATGASAGEGPRYQGERVGGVGLDRRHSGEQQGGEGKESCRRRETGVDQALDNRNREQNRSMGRKRKMHSNGTSAPERSCLWQAPDPLRRGFVPRSFSILSWEWKNTRIREGSAVSRRQVWSGRLYGHKIPLPHVARVQSS